MFAEIPKTRDVHVVDPKCYMAMIHVEIYRYSSVPSSP